MKKSLLGLLIAVLSLMNVAQAMTVTLEGQAAVEYLAGLGYDIHVVDDWNDLTIESNSTLSRENKCVVQPQFYCNARYKDRGAEFSYDMTSLGTENAISANQVKRQLEIGKRNYGIYLKFTPSKMDDGYQINRFDFVFFDPKGNRIFTTGCDTDVTCRHGYYISWSFFNLMDMFSDQLRNSGKIATGRYSLDIYFNEKWAGNTTFKVAK